MTPPISRKVHKVLLQGPFCVFPRDCRSVNSETYDVISRLCVDQKSSRARLSFLISEKVDVAASSAEVDAASMLSVL